MGKVIKISVDIPSTHVRALAWLKERTGETRSQMVRNLIAMELGRRAESNETLRRILRGEEIS